MLFPTYLAGASVLLLLLQHVRSRFRRTPDHAKPGTKAVPTTTESHNGLTTRMLNSIRLASCLILSGISAYAFWTKQSLPEGAELRLSLGAHATEEIAQLCLYVMFHHSQSLELCPS